MGDIIVFLLENYGGWIIVAAIVGFLLLEFLLDLAKDLLIDWIKDKREDRGESEWGNTPPERPFDPKDNPGDS